MLRFHCLALLLGCSIHCHLFTAAWGQTVLPPAVLVEAAKKEGQVVFYTPLNINDSRPLLQRFEQRYPFIKTELLRMSAEPLLNRILTEDRAGRSVVDVINNTVINALKKARLLQAHRSPEFPAYLDQFKDTEGYWASLNNNYYVLGYNTKLVSAKEAPSDWQDLLNPKWRGKIGMDQEERSNGLPPPPTPGDASARATITAPWRSSRFIGARATL